MLTEVWYHKLLLLSVVFFFFFFHFSFGDLRLRVTGVTEQGSLCVCDHQAAVYEVWNSIQGKRMTGDPGLNYCHCWNSEGCMRWVSFLYYSGLCDPNVQTLSSSFSVSPFLLCCYYLPVSKLVVWVAMWTVRVAQKLVYVSKVIDTEKDCGILLNCDWTRTFLRRIVLILSVTYMYLHRKANCPTVRLVLHAHKNWFFHIIPCTGIHTPTAPYASVL